MRPKKVDFVSCKGGLDLASNTLKMPPGSALGLLNFEPELEGGYRRINGYERVDGRAAPSDAAYYTVEVADASGISVGDTLTGATSGATSKVIVKDSNTLGVTALSGNYTLSETANGTTIAAVEVQSGQTDPDTDDIWQLAAEDYYRDLIGAVPGSGDVLGAVTYGSTKYAFRWDGSAAVKMYKSSASGWTEVSMYRYIFFDGGTLADGDIAEGTTITGATSGSSATVKKFIKNAGSYGTDASGYMVIDVTSGPFQDNEDIQVSAVTKCVADGIDTAIALSNNGGTFQFEQNNFYGSTATRYLYGCDGKNFPWEFDGTVLTPIFYPAPDKNPSWHTPTYIEVHRQHLFLTYATGQLAHSSIGEPLIFNELMGSGEFGLGDEPTGMVSRAGEVLAIYTRNRTYGLYGYSSLDWTLQLISETSGARHRSVQRIGRIYALDDKGIAPLDRVEKYGDFESATVSRFVQSILSDYKDSIVASVTIRDRNQYWLLFNDGRGLIMGDDQYLGDSLPAFSEIQLTDIPTCASSGEDENGNEIVLFGDSSGYVYELQKGYNFDGETIEFAYRTPFMHQKSPQLRKSYSKLYVDMDVGHSFDIGIGFDVSYGDVYTAINNTVEASMTGGGGYWDVAEWDLAYWDSAAFSSAGIDLAGNGKNISILFYGDSKYIRPFVVESLEIHYKERRLKSGK